MRAKRTDDRSINEMVSALGISRRGARVEKAVQSANRILGFNGLAERDDRSENISFRAIMVRCAWRFVICDLPSCSGQGFWASRSKD